MGGRRRGLVRTRSELLYMRRNREERDKFRAQVKNDLFRQMHASIHENVYIVSL